MTLTTRRNDLVNYLNAVNNNVSASVAPRGPACTINGSPGNDVLVGTAGPDLICAGAGHDVVVGLGGNDTILGGAGTDTCSGEHRHGCEI